MRYTDSARTAETSIPSPEAAAPFGDRFLCLRCERDITWVDRLETCAPCFGNADLVDELRPISRTVRCPEEPLSQDATDARGKTISCRSQP